MINISLEDITKLNIEQKCFFFFFLLEYGTVGAAIGFGANLLIETTSGSPGFRFLGVTLILIGLILLIILCYGGLSFSREPGHALTKSACYSVPLLAALAALGTFALAVSCDGGGKSLPGRSYKEYEVESYSKWMQNRVNNTFAWENYYKEVVVKHNVCKLFDEDYKQDSIDAFHKRNLSPFESGCCKPPEECNFSYTSPEVWVKPENETTTTYPNVDCGRWENNPNKLCFNCQSCKAAFLEDVTNHWFKRGLILVLLSCTHFLMGIYLICIRFGNDSSRHYILL